ncbi:cytochrome-c peroxidase [Yersinia pseudotuberculosis]|uniref:Cytochrome c peroxidase n=1 Tax=Yersinia pseudotuberculosis TaxID=633 RepID=A0A380QCN1_YERPU|nr:cytochrome-c peroxidase [Yersinia pseudotuberculosis]PSH11782.1 cytochrome-c peroxidase [Yersinia pseudotuberculosis]SUP85747.1 cytochrome c peroxidase [Yersinia pseudotuberculosis]
MIRRGLMGGGILVVAGYLGIAGYLYMTDNTRNNTFISEAKTPNQQVSNIFYQKGCDYCHTANASLPFYAAIPGPKQLMDYDIRQGNQHFSLEPTLLALKENRAVPEADLAKIESSIARDQMPPQRFSALHWSSSINAEERNQILDWVKIQRATYFPSNSHSEMQHLALQPIPDALLVDSQKVALGSRLFHDPRLSGDNTISCASCHLLNKGGVDNLATSTGVDGQKGGINAPTVFNAVFNVEQFWDGRAVDLQQQAGGPPLNPVEMASTSWEEIIAKLQQDPQLTQDFAQAYPQGYSEDTITDAIAEFEKTLTTPNSPFDHYLKGETQALTASQQKGLALFQQNKCDTCHVGKNIGGQSYEFLGLKGDYFADRQKEQTTDDLGRFNVTNDPRDMHRFKTPSLRNIALTAPYFHDAQAKDLHQAVELMLKYQVGTQLPEQDINDIVAFLESLTGEYIPHS